jgi:hypothetical protein
MIAGIAARGGVSLKCERRSRGLPSPVGAAMMLRLAILPLNARRKARRAPSG